MPIEDLNKPATCAMQRVNEFSKILHLEIDINNKLWLALARVLTGQLAQQPGAVSGLPLIISMMPPPRVRAVQRAQAAQAHHNLPLLSARPGNEWRRDTAPAAAGLLAP